MEVHSAAKLCTEALHFERNMTETFIARPQLSSSASFTGMTPSSSSILWNLAWPRDERAPLQHVDLFWLLTFTTDARVVVVIVILSLLLLSSSSSSSFVTLFSTGQPARKGPAKDEGRPTSAWCCGLLCDALRLREGSLRCRSSSLLSALVMLPRAPSAPEVKPPMGFRVLPPQASSWGAGSWCTATRVALTPGVDPTPTFARTCSSAW